MRSDNYKEVLDKWQIDAKEYSPWVPAVNVAKVFDAYKKKWGIKRDSDLAKKTGIAKQQISYVRVRSRRNDNVTTLMALATVDQMGIDPRFLLKDKKAPVSQDEASNAIEVLFLGAYSDDNERAAMIKYKKQVRLYVQKLVEQEKTENAQKLKEILGA